MEVPASALEAGLSEEEVRLITEENTGYVLKFKAVEWWQMCIRDREYAMLAFLVDAAYLVGGLLGILLLLLPFLGSLAVCVIYLMFDIIEGFRKRRGLP